MATKSLVPNPKFRAFTDAGGPLSGGKVYFFEAGTTTAKDTFNSYLGTSANTNPVILDSNGEADIWYTPGELYKVRVDTSADVTRWTVDNVSPGGADSLTLQQVTSIANLRLLTAGTADNQLVEVTGYYLAGDKGGGLFYWASTSTASDDDGTIFLPSTSPASGRWIRLFEGDVSIRWFGAKGDFTGSSGTDDVTAINKALAYCNTNNLNALVPVGAFYLSTFLSCAVSLIGDQKGKIEDNAIYGSATWTSIGTANLTGSVFIWDKSTLGVTDSYMRNVSGADTSDMQISNMTFISQTASSVGGGNLFVVDSAQAGTEYDFGSQPTFKDCHIVNFNIAMTINLYNTWTISDIIFKGCKQPILAGNSTPQEATDIHVDRCSFLNCGDTSTNFISLDNVQGFQFNQCSFDTTSAIGIRIALNQGLAFTGCYFNTASLNSAGDFIVVVSTSGFNCDNVSFYKCISGGVMGDINLIQSTNIATLTLIDSVLTGATVPLGTSNVTITEFGNVTIDGVTGTGRRDKFGPGGFSYDNTIISGGLISRVDNTSSTSISGGSAIATSNGALLSLAGNTGGGDAVLSAGTGTNDGDVSLVTSTGQQIKVTNTDDATSGTTGAMTIAGGLGVVKNLAVGVALDLAGTNPDILTTIAVTAADPAAAGNAICGIQTMQSAQDQINTTAVKSGSFISTAAMNASAGGSGVDLYAHTIVDGTSFQINNTSGGIVSWMIINAT